MNEKNESDDDDNYDKELPLKDMNKNRGRKSQVKKDFFQYNNGDDIEDSDTEDIFEL
jgi:hypothetical protein